MNGYYNTGHHDRCLAMYFPVGNVLKMRIRLAYERSLFQTFDTRAHDHRLRVGSKLVFVSSGKAPI